MPAAAQGPRRHQPGAVGRSRSVGGIGAAHRRAERAVPADFDPVRAGRMVGQGRPKKSGRVSPAAAPGGWGKKVEKVGRAGTGAGAGREKRVESVAGSVWAAAGRGDQGRKAERE